MPRGHPDYNEQGYAIAIGEVDNADVVAAVRGFLRVDGRGRVLFIDTFNNGLGGWRAQTGGGASAPYVTADSPFVFTPPVSAKFDAVQNGGTCNIYRNFGLLKDGDYAVEASFYMTTNNSGWRLIAYRDDADGNRLTASLELDRGEEDFRILTDTGEVSIYDYSADVDVPEGWLFVKLVFNTITGKYRRAIIGTNEINLDGQEMDTLISGLNSGFAVQIVANGLTGFVEPTALGYVILTTDEP